MHRAQITRIQRAGRAGVGQSWWQGRWSVGARCSGLRVSRTLKCVLWRVDEQALTIKDGRDFQHILRILGTNVDGRQKVMYAMTSVKGIGRRFSNIVCKKADVDMDKRAGELTQKEMDDLVNVVQNPNEYKIPSWMLNRRKDFKDGKTTQISSNQIDAKLRDDLERLKKIRNHRGLRHYWGIRVRGQHTKTTGRRGKTVGVSKKKG